MRCNYLWRCLSSEDQEGKGLEPNFQFRLNGIILPRIIVRQVMVNGCPTDRREIVACDEQFGLFRIDDNENLADPALPKFVLEVCDFSIPTTQRKSMPNEGWQRMTTQECIALLEAAGV
jgi:hypothetical protein